MTDELRKLDAEVAEKVIGWRVEWTDAGGLGLAPWVSYDGSTRYLCEHYSTDPAADYSVLVKVRETWDADARELFLEALQDVMIERSSVTKGIGLAWLAMYRPGDYSRAALAALRSTGEKC